MKRTIKLTKGSKGSYNVKISDIVGADIVSQWDGYFDRVDIWYRVHVKGLKNPIYVDKTSYNTVKELVK